jgi:ER degradation enhancer, mannosidase alpha-like 1
MGCGVLRIVAAVLGVCAVFAVVAMAASGGKVEQTGSETPTTFPATAPLVALVRRGGRVKLAARSLPTASVETNVRMGRSLSVNGSSAAAVRPAVPTVPVSRAGLLRWRERVRAMFHHGYDSYMRVRTDVAIDELGPLLCKGRGPDRENPANINVNDALGGYSLTLIEALTTLAVMGNRTEFERAVRLVNATVTFDVDSNVQVFEATIRVLGALLSAHLAATEPGFLDVAIPNYDGCLLRLAEDLGRRLLPAFDTPTGLPWPRINLRSSQPWTEWERTCPAGAGTLLVEFGVLSRLVNDSVFERVARRALVSVFERRSELGLLGNEMNVVTGEWTSRMATIGAGVDSLFEYLLKGYILFDDADLLVMFAELMESVNAHQRARDLLVYRNVDMDTGQMVNMWVDSLSAFWPGLLVLAGDVPGAVRGHVLHQMIWTRYRALPERFDLQLRDAPVAFYPLRPELAESTYWLFRATRDPMYLEFGKRMVEDLERYRTQCGFGTVHDVRAWKGEGQVVLEDRMESFFLSETLKYLYLLFDEANSLHRSGAPEVLFTTEGHPLPVGAWLRNAPERFETMTLANLWWCPALPDDARLLPVVSPRVQRHVRRLAGLGETP